MDCYGCTSLARSAYGFIQTSLEKKPIIPIVPATRRGREEGRMLSTLCRGGKADADTGLSLALKSGR